MILGNAPIDESIECSLQFHQYIIYDKSWPSGTVKYNATTGNFYIVPDVQEETLIQPSTLLFSQNNSPFKKGNK